LNILLGDYGHFRDDIKQEELFCLCCATLLHDIVMTKSPRLRAGHSAEARRIIRQEFENAKGTFTAFNLPDSLVDCIADIVFAHSDVKDDRGNVVERSLEVVRDQVHSGETGRIRTYLLAALLRLGDELDCTSERINGAQRLNVREQVAANPHWRTCALIREVAPPPPSRTDIVLKVNDLALTESDDKANDLALIRRQIAKLTASLNEVRETVFTPKSIEWWHYVRVTLAPESAELTTRLESLDPLGTALTPEALVSGDREPPSNIATGKEPQEARNQREEGERQTEQTIDVASADLGMSQKLNKWVRERNMLMDGHYNMPGGRHARDWIDTSQLLEDRAYLGQIAKSFIAILEQRGLGPREAVVLGAGFPGLIIASQMSFISGYGCSYAIPLDTGDREEEWRKLPHIPSEKRVVLVTDVIAEGRTIESVLNSLREKEGVLRERVTAVLTVFLRRPTKLSGPLGDWAEGKLVPLNTDFPIQLCDKRVAECVFYKEGLVDVINEDLNR
jgi:orotate phosphoribosyltransferase